MNRKQTFALTALLGLALASLTTNARAQNEPSGSRTEIAVSGGVHVLNKNDTALPDQFINIPLVASIGYRLTPVVAVEGEFTWLIPVQQSVDLGAGSEQDRKTPDILAYQANVRANLPLATTWSPYLVAGAGALTYLSNTDADRVPQLAESQTMFALNFGAGASYALTDRWGLRADFRELVAFPADDAAGFSDASGADPIWMERVTLGFGYRF
jgi:opacity protein-like surface antigen